MENPNNFRFAKKPNPISQLESQILTQNYKDNFFLEEGDMSSLPKTTNFGVLISKKMWIELTNEIFFNSTDFQQNDGVQISFGFEDNNSSDSNSLILLFQAFSTDKDDNGEDDVFAQNGKRLILMKNSTKSKIFSTLTSIDGGGGGATQIPPPPPSH